MSPITIISLIRSWYEKCLWLYWRKMLGAGSGKAFLTHSIPDPFHRGVTADWHSQRNRMLSSGTSWRLHSCFFQHQHILRCSYGVPTTFAPLFREFPVYIHLCSNCARIRSGVVARNDEPSRTIYLRRDHRQVVFGIRSHGKTETFSGPTHVICRNGMINGTQWDQLHLTRHLHSYSIQPSNLLRGVFRNLHWA